MQAAGDVQRCRLAGRGRVGGDHDLLDAVQGRQLEHGLEQDREMDRESEQSFRAPHSDGRELGILDVAHHQQRGDTACPSFDRYPGLQRMDALRSQLPQ